MEHWVGHIRGTGYTTYEALNILHMKHRGGHRILQPRTKKSAQGWAKAKQGITLASAEAKFRRHLAASPNIYKIHTEIQILFYYDMHPNIRRPTVVCSSKSACFLCDLFIKIHAKFYVAGTHGVLYCRLPKMQQAGWVGGGAGAGGLSFVKDGGSFSRLNRLLQIQVIQHQYLRYCSPEDCS